MIRDSYLAGIHYRISLDRLFTAEEIDKFVALYQNRSTTESEIHRFFHANPKFLYLLGAYKKVLSEVPFSGKREGEADPLQNFRLDFLLQHYDNVWDVVELKKPRLTSGRLVVGTSARPRFPYEIQDAVAQARVYLDQLSQAEVQRELKSRGIIVCRPMAWIIAGRNDDVSVSEKRFLQQSLPASIRVVTYDDLAELSKQRALIVRRSFQPPLITTLFNASSSADAPTGVPSIRSAEEVAQAVAALSTADLLRLKVYAHWCARSLGRNAHGGDANDLLREAVSAAVENPQMWQDKIPFASYLMDTIWNITSNSWQKTARKEAPESEMFQNEQEVQVSELYSIDPERILNAKEELQRLRLLFVQDAAASTVVELLSMGYTRGEIQSRLAVSSEEMTAVTRRIRRRIIGDCFGNTPLSNRHA